VTPELVDALSYEELRRVTQGQEPVPLLADVLSRCNGRARMIIDVKQQGIASSLRRLLEVERATESWIWTHDGLIARECINEFRAMVPVSLIVRPDLASLWGRHQMMRLARDGGLDGLLFEHPDVDQSLLERAAEVGLSLHCGRTNEPADISRVRSLSVASISSDFPERLLAHTALLPT
jgi:hypothetical protein